MSAYLFTFRPPSGYEPSAATFAAWSSWQLELGVRLKDRGNPGFAAASVGAGVAGTCPARSCGTGTTSPGTRTCRGSLPARQAVTPAPTRTPERS